MTAQTTKQPNPHEVSLSKFYQTIAHPVMAGYVKLRNGVLMTEASYSRLKERDLRTRKEKNAIRRRAKAMRVKRWKS